MGSGVEPGEAAAQDLGAEFVAVKIPGVDVGDFELAACGGFEAAGYIDYAGVVEVDAGDGVARFGLERLLFERDGAALRVELDYAVALRIEDGVGEDGCTGGVSGGFAGFSSIEIARRLESNSTTPYRSGSFTG